MYTMGTGASYKPVAEAWAVYNEDNIGKPHKSRSRVRFYERDYYSYQTVVATYFKNKAGKLYVLATNHRYSITTNSHIKIAMGQVGNVPIFRVPFLHDNEESCLMNAKALYEDVMEFADEAIRQYRRPTHDSWYGTYAWPARLRKAHDNFCQYLKITGASIPHMTLVELLEHVRTTRKEKLDKFTSPEEVRKRERAHARRLALKVV